MTLHERYVVLVDVLTERRARVVPVAGSKTTLRQAVIDPTAPATVIVIAHERDRGATLNACAINGAERRLAGGASPGPGLIKLLKGRKSRERALAAARGRGGARGASAFGAADVAIALVCVLYALWHAGRAPPGSARASVAAVAAALAGALLLLALAPLVLLLEAQRLCYGRRLLLLRQPLRRLPRRLLRRQVMRAPARLQQQVAELVNG